MAYHRPVLLNESIEGLNIKSKGTYVDLTFGGGGHSRLVLEKLGKKGRLFAFDQDPDAAQNISKDKRLVFIKANFRYMRNFLRYYEVPQVDGILADLGISSYQIDQPERGFSFRSESRLDMRMDPNSRKTAVEVLNDYPEDDLFRIFRRYGELKNTGRVVRAIIEARVIKPVTTTTELETILEDLVPQQTRSKFMARVFQAIRIEVNEEIDALREMLVQTSDYMGNGGRLVVITYHSLEDRLVKNYMRSGNLEGEVKKDFYGNPETSWMVVNRKVIVPGEKEISENSRARSAKLRIAEKL
ncbi:MAG: 16S rRNA (cytosine(1402)-N(4))-methyltransferase RsmH [Bacteroidales bacterium]